MPSGLELDRFLGELRTRQQRLLTLADPQVLRPSDLVDELHELSEQLIVAEEELRVQQEELDAAHGALLTLSAERDLLLRHSAGAYVVTDENGIVLESTRSAQQLVRQPQVRLVPRPIASWFEVADRRAVRSMVSRARTSIEPERMVGLHLHRPGDDPVRVDVVLVSVSGPTDDRTLLRWELVPAVRLHALPDPEPGPVAGVEDPLALRLAETALELQTCRTHDELETLVRVAALRLIPGAREVDLALDETVCTDGPAAAEVRDRHTVAVPLVVGPRRLGALVVHGEDDEPLQSGAEAAAYALGVQVALALTRLRELQDLHRATNARQVVGQAVGLLVERRRITPDDAFALLVRWSQEENVKLRTLAVGLVETGQEPRPPRRP